MAEYKLSYTAEEINERLGLVEKIKEVGKEITDLLSLQTRTFSY